MEQTPSRHDSKTKKNNKSLNIIPWVGTALFILTIAAGAYFYATKQLVLTVGGTVTATSVCGDTIVSTYNSASELKARGGDTNPAVDLAGLATLDKDIRAKTGFDQDPTCQTILFWDALTTNDPAKAQTALTAIEKLHDSHHYADSNLMNTTSISTMKDSLSAVNAESKG